MWVIILQLVLPMLLSLLQWLLAHNTASLAIATTPEQRTQLGQLGSRCLRIASQLQVCQVVFADESMEYGAQMNTKVEEELKGFVVALKKFSA